MEYFILGALLLLDLVSIVLLIKSMFNGSSYKKRKLQNYIREERRERK